MLVRPDDFTNEIIALVKKNPNNENKILNIFKNMFSTPNSMLYTDLLLKGKIPEIHHNYLVKIAKGLNIDVDQYFEPDDLKLDEILNRLVNLEVTVAKQNEVIERIKENRLIPQE